MVSKSKLFSKLDELEKHLQDSLVPHLKNAALGRNDYVFCVSAFNPYRKLHNKTDRLTEELVEIGAQVLALRAKLGEPSEGTIAEKICWYCRKWSDSQGKHKIAGAVLAKQFLIEIEAL